MWPGGSFRTDLAAARRRGRRLALDPRGQGLVEFAIAFPVVMLMITFGIDFGRVFLGWVTLNNAVREAANFAAINPAGFQSPINNVVLAEYRRLITSETTGINCSMPGTPPNPTYPSGTALGSPAVVAISCRFSLITPVISNILGSAINVSAAASFPVRAGSIDGVPVGQGLPTVGPSASPIDTGGGGGTPTATPTVTAVPTCTVPNLVDVQSSAAVNRWTGAGFAANNLAFNPLVPPGYKVRTQSEPAGSGLPCTGSMTVTP